MRGDSWVWSETGGPSNELRDEPHEVAQGCQVTHKLFRLWSDLVPDWIELLSNNDIEHTRLSVFNHKVIEIKLSDDCEYSRHG